MFDQIQKLRETKGKEKETLQLINQSIINLLWEKALTYQHLKDIKNLEIVVNEAKDLIDKYKLKEFLPTYYLFMGKINDLKGKFSESVKFYKKAPKTAETQGHLAYALIMSGKANLGFKLAQKALKDVDSIKKDYYTWAVWKSGIVIRTVVALLTKKAKFDQKLINKWVSEIEKDLSKKGFDFGYRLAELEKLKKKLQSGSGWNRTIASTL